MLHIVTTGPNSPAHSIPFASHLEESDEVLLLGDGVYWILTRQFSAQIYALTEDCETRGLSVESLSLKLIDFDEFVVLTERHNPIVTW